MTILAALAPSPANRVLANAARPEASVLALARSSPFLATRATRTPGRVLAVFSERTTTSSASEPS